MSYASETKNELARIELAYWNTVIHDWHVETGSYEIQIGRSVRDIKATQEIAVQSSLSLPKSYNLNSRLGELMKDPKANVIFESFAAGMGGASQAQNEPAENSDGAISPEMMEAMIAEMPLRALLSFVPGLKRESLQQMVDMLNQ